MMEVNFQWKHNLFRLAINSVQSINRYQLHALKHQLPNWEHSASPLHILKDMALCRESNNFLKIHEQGNLTYLVLPKFKLL